MTECISPEAMCVLPEHILLCDAFFGLVHVRGARPTELAWRSRALSWLAVLRSLRSAVSAGHRRDDDPSPATRPGVRVV